MNKYIWLSILASLFITLSYAQQSLERDSFVIVKEFVPTLSQASKIRINPEIKDTHHLELDLKYTFLVKDLETEFKPEPIKAATLKGEPLIKLRRNYLILGYGNNATPLAEFYFNQLRSKKFSYSVNARHLSSSGIQNIENSGYSNNDVGLVGNYYSRKYTVTGRMNYSYDHINYYGFNKEIPGLNIGDVEQNLDIMQFYNDFGAAVELSNNQRDTIGLRHNTKMAYNMFSDRYGASESRFLLKQNISLLNNNDVYLFDWAVDYNKYSFEDEEVLLDSNNENTLIYLKPGIELKGAKWKLIGKIHVVADLNKETRLDLYPHVDFRYHLIKSIIIPYAGMTGDIHRNTYKSFVEANPFISPLFNLQNTNESLTVYGGIGGNLSKNTSFDVSFARSSYQNMALFVKDTNSREMRSFTVVYDDVTQTNVTAEVVYEPLRRWNLAVKGEYFMYDTDKQLEAWHKPDYRLSVLLGYNLGDKILVKLMTYMIGSQKAKLYTLEESETLKGTVDLNLDLEYRYSKKVSVFLDLNNLASVRYEKYQDYPTQRLNLLGGFKFSF